MTVAHMPPAAAASSAPRGAGVRSVYQPIVDLDSRETVAFEALARGPLGSEFERPDRLFATARELGCVGELDQACRRSAVAGARAAGLSSPWTLFVNVEPAALRWSIDRLALEHAFAELAQDAVPIIVEITERDLTADPVTLLRFVDAVRAQGCGIALDDVGAERASLALLPLIRPDVIKLDLKLVQQRPSAHIAEIFGAVNAEAERSGAVVLAEGIETEDHLGFARALGAQLGQGWLLGRPGPLPEKPIEPVHPVLRGAPDKLSLDASPFAVAAAGKSVRIGRKQLLIEVSKHLEREALRTGDSVVVVSALQHERFFTPATRERYLRLADAAAFAAIIGEGIAARPLPGLRGGDLHPEDPVVGEWDVVVLGPHFAAALVASDFGDSAPDSDRRFEYVLTHDRDTVVAVATALLGRITDV